mgnify:CR=1 FL=1
MNISQVKTTGSNGCGGILGATLQLKSLTIIVDSCENTGAVQGAAYVGGIVGLPRKSSTDSIIKDCVSKGDVKGNSYVGGVVGAARIDVSDAKVLYSLTLTVSSTAKAAYELQAKGDSSTAGYIAATAETTTAGTTVTISGKLINADGTDYTA